MNRFDQRVAVVTGGGHGIGRATVRRLAAEGARVAVADVDQAAAGAVAGELGHQGIAILIDVTDSSSVNAAMHAAAEHFGQIDVLVNTAGGGLHEGSIESARDEDWQSLLELNLFNVMRCVRAAIPHLRQSAYGGNVVSIGSVNGSVAFGGYAYSAAKAGLELVTRNLAAEFGSEGMRFNLIAPGTINTRVWDDQPESRERLRHLYPLGRIGEPEDIAAAVAFLASDDAAWITGITLPVEGGVTTGPIGWMRQQQQ